MNLFNRAQRIADATGDACPLTVDGDMYVVCEGDLDAAERLTRSQMEPILAVHSESVSICEDCGAATLNNACGYPTDWYPVEAMNGDLLGFVCEACGDDRWLVGPEWHGPKRYTPAGGTHWYR